MTLEATKSILRVEASTPDILTPRLELIAITHEMIRAGFARSPDFAELVNAELPEGWPRRTGTTTPTNTSSTK